MTTNNPNKAHGEARVEARSGGIDRRGRVVRPGWFRLNGPGAVPLG